MSIAHLTLKEFVRLTPVCDRQATIKSVLAIFESSQCSAIVTVNKQLSPTGIIHAQPLMGKLLENLPATLTDSSRLLDKSVLLCPMEQLGMVEPIATLPAHMSVKEFCIDLQASNIGYSSNKSFAIVDSAGKFLGLLDNWSLLKSLSINKQAPDTDGVKEPQTDKFSDYGLLEELPLPLMLQTADGQIITKNRTWHEQIGELLPKSSKPHAVKKNEPAPSSGQKSLVGQMALFGRTVEPHCLKEPRTAKFSQVNFHSLPPQFSTSDVAIYEEDDRQSLQAKIPHHRDREKGKTWEFVKLPLNHPNLILVLAKDITEQQQNKELAAKNADLVQLNQLKDEFLTCISHELKSPLTSVVGLSSLLKEQKLGNLNERQARYAELIYQSGRQLMTLVNDILDLTRLETGKLKLTPEPVEIKTICQNAYEQASAKESESSEQIKFTLDIQPGLDVLVADRLRLRQMLVHLLNNALKFTLSGGEIGLAVSRWENWIAFTVWDTGIGIESEFQHLIFQKFQQLENPLTGKFEGTGLGLVLTQRLARAHGGDVSFISQQGKGSQFTILLPPSPTQKERATQHSDRGVSDRLILIVEAAPVDLENLTGKLKQLGYLVVIARTGTEALEKARFLQPGKIFLNPSIPLLSGWDVLTLLRSDERTKEIPVIITASETLLQQAEQNGANGFVSLPVKEEALRESLAPFVKERSQQSRKLRILCLYPGGDKTSMKDSALAANFDLALLNRASSLNHCILEADSLEQADLLARVWKLDVVLLDGSVLLEPLKFLRSLSEYESLASLPFVTLDPTTTEAANQVSDLSVFPCLVPGNEQSLDELLEVIEIAASMDNDE